MKIRSISDLQAVAEKSQHILTLFSGGLDSSYVLKILAEQRCRVTALAVDLGDGVNRHDLQEIASRFGAHLQIIDAQELFATSAVLPAIQAQARYMNLYPISSSLSRPVIAQLAVELAQREGCDAIVHTANQSQNSLRRLNGAIEQLGFSGFYGSPYEYSAITREQKIQELSKLGLPRFQARGVSGDANLWVREFESGVLDNPEQFSVPDGLFVWTAPRQAATEVELQFVEGVPVALNGQQMRLVALIDALNWQAGAFGIGRYAGLEHLEQGEKVLEVREAPAAQLLMEAYRHLEMASLDAELLREKQSLEQIWVREAIEGRWFGMLRNAAQSFIQTTTAQIDGIVRFTLRQGAADVCAIRSNRARYLTERDAWEVQIAAQRASRHLHIPTVQQIFPLKEAA